MTQLRVKVFNHEGTHRGNVTYSEKKYVLETTRSSDKTFGEVVGKILKMDLFVCTGCEGKRFFTRLTPPSEIHLLAFAFLLKSLTRGKYWALSESVARVSSPRREDHAS